MNTGQDWLLPIEGCDSFCPEGSKGGKMSFCKLLLNRLYRMGCGASAHPPLVNISILGGRLAANLL